MTKITKQLFILSVVSFFLFTGGIVHAQTADGTVQPGGACTADINCADVNGQSYGCFNGTTCTLNGDAPGPSTTSGNFVPLTNLPTFQGITGQPDLKKFFNSLYMICIGIAATLAVIQITIAGVMYMGGDSVTETKQAKQKISQAIIGLVLVLSPVIVFSIINPSILNLSIGGLSKLAPSPTTTTDSQTSTPTGAPTCTTPIENNAPVPSSNDQACCKLQTSRGCKVTLSIPKAGDAPSLPVATCGCNN